MYTNEYFLCVLAEALTGSKSPFYVQNRLLTIQRIASRGRAILLLFGVLTLSADVKAQTADNFNYKTSGTSVTITRYTGNANVVTIPNTVMDLQVTSIGDNAFFGCTNLASVTIPGSVTSIGRAAFYACTRLASVTIPNSVSNIGAQAFSDCVRLTSVTIPSKVTSIEGSVFSGCTGLTSVTIPNSVTSIGSHAFSGCYSLPSVTIPDSVRSIGNSAFAYCTRLSIEVIPNSVASIGDYVFYYCPNLTAIAVAADNNAFCSLDGVLFDKTQNVLIAYPGGKGESYLIPNQVTSIGRYAFGGCTRLLSVAIAEGVTNIAHQAFSGCTSLVDVKIPNTLVSIGDGTFSRCTSLASVTIPNSVTGIGSHAFLGCTNLIQLYFEGNAPTLGSGGDLFGLAFGEKATATVYYRSGTTGWGATFAGRPTALWIPSPSYDEWARSTGLLEKYPNARGMQDDPDQDGMSKFAEKHAGTDPTRRESMLALELPPLTSDWTAEDRTPISSSQIAVYFRSVPGKVYQVRRASSWGSGWTTEITVTATTTQKRVVLDKRAQLGFYRILVVPAL